MSHFVELKVDFIVKNEKSLVEALEQRFGAGNVEVHENGAPLYGWHGDDRSVLKHDNPNYAPPCNIIVRRKNVGSASNDIGYRRTEDGKYVAYISDYDKHSTFGPTQQNKVAQDYAERVATKSATRKGWKIKDRVEEKGVVKMRFYPVTKK